jgi:hypothetical protein
LIALYGSDQGQFWQVKLSNTSTSLGYGFYVVAEHNTSIDRSVETVEFCIEIPIRKNSEGKSNRVKTQMGNTEQV